MKMKIALASLLLATQGSIKCYDLTDCDREKEIFIPIEHAEELHDLFFSPAMTAVGKLHRKKSSRVVVAMNGDASPTVAMRATVLEFGTKLLYPYKILIAVFVLNHCQLCAAPLANFIAYLGVLARNFDVIRLSILEFGEIMAQKIERLNSRSRFKKLFVLVPPLL
jgi:hypothetical protein